MARLGVIGVLAGVAAAGVAAGVAAERALVGRTRKVGDDPYADEPFGRLPYDESLLVTTSDGIEVYVEVLEPNDGVVLEFDDLVEPEPTIVFVHGFCLDMGTFHLQRRYLDGGQYRMVFYDQPGHGRSSKLKSGNYDIAGLGESLGAVLNATVPDGHIILVGHSMGGMTIMSFAEKYPEFQIEVGLRDYYLAEAQRLRNDFDKAAELAEKLALGRSIESFLDRAADYDRRIAER